MKSIREPEHSVPVAHECDICVIGGTLIALAADEIVMCEHAVLGPVDPQLGQYPAASILAAVQQNPWRRLTIRP